MFPRVQEIEFGSTDAYNSDSSSRTENFGTIRLYKFSSFQGSQTDMLISTFDNEITEDDTFVAEIDERCLDPENFPLCANGVYTES